MSGRVWPKGSRRLQPSTEPPLWGWHRLSDRFARRVVEAAGVQPGDLVVDIGAGDGALTSPLLAAGAYVIAVELHPGRCDALRARYAGERVTVIEADATGMRWPRQPFRVVANPPYAIWRTLLRSLMSRHSRLVSADVVLQRRVVRQIVDRGAAGTNLAGRGYVLERGMTVPRGAFHPPPRVDSAVLKIRRVRTR